MTSDINLNSLRDAGLTPNQAEFILEFLKPDSARAIRLIAPAGTGKTHTAIKLISLLVREQSASHVLVITPSRATIYWYDRELKENIFYVPVVPLDKKRIRLIESDLSPGENLFLQPLIALSTFHQSYDERIGEALLSAVWDLIVIDEAHYLEKGSNQAAFTRRLLDSKRAKRFLLLSGPDAEELGQFAFPEIATIEWTSSIFDWEGNPLLYNLELDKRVIQYERSQGEIEFLTILQNYEPIESDENRTRNKKSVLLRLASSSLYAIEQSLLRQSYRMAHPSENSGTDELSETVETEERPNNEIESSFDNDYEPAPQSDEHTRQQLATIIEVLERVPEDNKLQALIKEISRIRNENPTASYLILSSYVSTVNYLASALNEIDINVEQISGGMSGQSRESARYDFVQNGGILIASPIYLKGIEFGDAGFDVLIFYDLPQSNLTMANSLLFAFTRGTKRTIYLYALEDTSGVLPFEANRLKKFMAVFDSSLEPNEKADSAQMNLFESVDND